MKIDIKEYKKNHVDKNDMVTTGISIERHQKDFIEENDINLSAIVRAFLTELMAENKPSRKKGA